MPFVPLGQFPFELSRSGYRDPFFGTGIEIEPDRYIRSRNYDPGNTGWILNADGTGELTGLTLSGDLYSSDWDGGFDLSGGSDGTATAGWLLDYGSGSAQFEGSMFLGGTLELDGGTFRTASSGQRVEISDNDRIRFYTGLAAETNHGYIVASNADSANPAIWIQSPSTSATGHYIGVQADGVLIKRNAGTSGTVFDVEANAYGMTATIGPVTIADVVGGSNTNSLTLGTYIGLRAGASYMGFVEHVSSYAFYAEDGTESVPTYTFSGDLDSGMFYDSGPAFTKNGNMTMRVLDGSVDLFGDGSANEGGQLNFQGGTSYGTVIYLDRYQNNIRILYGGTEKIRFSGSAGDWTGIGAIRAGAVGGTLTAGYFYGIPGTTGSAANATWILATGSTYYIARSTSSRKYKNRITYNQKRLRNIKLRPTTHWRIDDKKWRYGFIAEDLADADERLVDEESPDYNAVLAVVVAQLDEAKERITALEAQLAAA